MPEKELGKLKGLGVRELARYFGVPEEIVRVRSKLWERGKKIDKGNSLLLVSEYEVRWMR